MSLWFHKEIVDSEIVIDNYKTSESCIMASRADVKIPEVSGTLSV